MTNYRELMFRGMPEFASSPSSRCKLEANSGILYQWYGLWMRIMGPHSYTITALGSYEITTLMCEVALIASSHVET